jgi:hypothetical protein
MPSGICPNHRRTDSSRASGVNPDSRWSAIATALRPWPKVHTTRVTLSDRPRPVALPREPTHAPAGHANDPAPDGAGSFSTGVDAPSSIARTGRASPALAAGSAPRPLHGPLLAGAAEREAWDDSSRWSRPVELPGVEPGCRGPRRSGSTCVGPGCLGCGTPEPGSGPHPHHLKVSRSARWSKPTGGSRCRRSGPPIGRQGQNVTAC